MSVEVNGIAHIQLTVNDAECCPPFWEKLCHFLGMKSLIHGNGVIYCIGSRTGILVRAAPDEKRGRAFDQDRLGPEGPGPTNIGPYAEEAQRSERGWIGVRSS